jgi:pyrimidine operon attenuation protein/uracil phosphoribosyltransferase
MVLADRGQRELPIAADFVGEYMQVPDGKILVLEKDLQGKSEVFRFVLEERV